MFEINDGKIVTELSDQSFIERVWEYWAGYNESEVDALRNDLSSNEMTDEVLRDEGFFVLEGTFWFEGESIFMHKVGYKTWIIKDDSGEEYTPEQLKRFVKVLLTGKTG